MRNAGWRVDLKVKCDAKLKIGSVWIPTDLIMLFRISRQQWIGSILSYLHFC
jgi:hypothetical protein